MGKERPKFLKDETFLYFDNAASTPPLLEVYNAVNEFLKDYGSIHRGFGEKSNKSTDAYERARETIARLVDAEDGVVVFTSNTTDAINLFATALRKSRVAVSYYEHSANYLPWVGKHEVVHLPWNENYHLTPEDLERFLRENRVDWVSIAGASNVTSYAIDIKGMYEVCQRYGVKLFIDASQYAAHYKISLKYCDAFAFSGHKIYAPYGGGVLVYRKGLLDRELNVYDRKGGGNIYYFNDEYVFYKPEPHNREVGTPNAVGAIAIAKALEVLNDFGWDNIHEIDMENYLTLYEGLRGIDGIKILFPSERMVYDESVLKTPIVVFQITKYPYEVMREKLKDKRIGFRYDSFCVYRLLESATGVGTYRGGDIKEHLRKISAYRLSPGLITTKEDVLKAIELFRELLK
jgi:selenocysteine lyase/cysteine desulfurase